MKYIYRKVKGKSGKTFYIPINDHPADGIHVTSVDKNGYNGREVEFRLDDETVDTVVGPFNVSYSHLKDETGIDLSDKHEYTVIYFDKWNGNVLLKTDRLIGNPYVEGFIENLAKNFPSAKYIQVNAFGGGHGKFVNAD